MAKNEFALAFNEMLEEKQLTKDVVVFAIESAMVSAYRRAVGASTAQHVEAKLDPDTGVVTVYAEKEVVEDNVVDDRTEVLLDVARKVNPEAQVGDMVVVETTPADFGRVAAQTARQVIQQRIREAERSNQMQYFERQVGEIVSGIVQTTNAQSTTIGLDMKAEGVMPNNQKIPGERLKLHDRIRAVVMEVKDGTRGPQIILSRAHRNFLRRLLENEVPEIYHGIVEIRAISREPGARAKVAVSATQAGIDPVGACVGIKGVRIQAIVKELHDEKIDIIQWDPDPIVYISKAISPARVNGVYLVDNEGARTATVVVGEDQLSLAIGRDGQNARLAAKLTGWRIDIKSLSEASGDALKKLQGNPELVRDAPRRCGINSTDRGNPGKEGGEPPHHAGRIHRARSVRGSRGTPHDPDQGGSHPRGGGTHHRRTRGRSCGRVQHAARTGWHKGTHLQHPHRGWIRDHRQFDFCTQDRCQQGAWAARHWLESHAEHRGIACRADLPRT